MDAEKEIGRLQDELDAKKRNSGSAETARLQARVASLQQKNAEASETSRKVKEENKRLEAQIQRLIDGCSDPSSTVATTVGSELSKSRSLAAPMEAKAERKLLDLEAQVRKLEQETTRLAEQRDALRAELKNTAKREQDLQVEMQQSKGKAAPTPEATEAVVAASASAALADRTELARKRSDAFLSKMELARRVPLIGRALGRMERRQELGQLSLSWEGWLKVINDQAEKEERMGEIRKNFLRIDTRMAMVRSIKGWMHLTAEARQFAQHVSLLNLHSTIRSLSGQFNTLFATQWLQKWKTKLAESKSRAKGANILHRALIRRRCTSAFFAWARGGHQMRLWQLKSRSNLSLYLPHAVQHSNYHRMT